MSDTIRRGDAIQPLFGGKLRDARAESDPYEGLLFADDAEPRQIIRWSHQASDSDRHWCVGALTSFRRIHT